MSFNINKRIYANYLQISEKSINVKDIVSSKYAFFYFIFNKFIKTYPKKSEIIEIACGPGVFGHYLQKNGYENYRGVDISEDQIKLSANIILGKCFNQDMFEFLDGRAPNSTDIVLAIDIFEHLSKRECSRLLSKVDRVLKNKGILITQFPNGSGIFGNDAFSSDLTHETLFNEVSFRGLCNMTQGLKLESTYEAGPFFTGIRSLFRVIIWKFFRLFFIIINAAEVGDLDFKKIYTRNIIMKIVKKK